MDPIANQPQDQKPKPPKSSTSSQRPEYRIPNIKFSESQEIINKLEEKIGFKLIVYYTCPEAKIISVHADLLYEQLKTLKTQENLGLVIISGGGDPTAALRLASLVRDYCQRLTIFVPTICASAATMLALAGNKVVMTPIGYLTAIDVSLIHTLNPRDPTGNPTRVSVDQTQRIIKFLNDEGPAKTENNQEGTYRTLFKYLHPLALAELDRSSSLSEMIACRIMMLHSNTYGGEEKIRSIANKLVKNYPMHGYPILYKEATEIGIPVERANGEVSDALHSLAFLYDSSSLPVITQFSPDLHHVEQMPSLIEINGKRVMRRTSFDRRLTRTWVKENDNSRWLKVIATGDPEKPLQISNIEVSEAPQIQTSVPVQTPGLLKAVENQAEDRSIEEF